MPQMPKSLLFRGVAEVLIIATGIILAISAETWWEERGDRQAETLHLLALREDFQKSLVLIGEAEEEQAMQISYLESLLGTEVAEASQEDLRRWLFGGVFNIWVYRPQVAALTDLESSGDIQLIQSAELRRALAGLRHTILAHASRQQDFVESQHALIDQYIVDHLDLVDILVQPGDGESHPIDPELLHSQAFRSRMAFKLGLRSIVAESLHDLRLAFEHCLDLIAGELEATHQAP